MIPMNGLGSRFDKENYHLPKPLIPMLGKPMLFWLLDNLNLQMVNSIIIPYTSVLDDYNFQQRVRNRYPQINFRFISINHTTRGAAETIRLGLRHLDQPDLEHNFMLMDCDTFYYQDIISDYQNNINKNCIFHFTDTQDRAIYSYVQITDGMVTDIAEKRRISNHANCGVYCFTDGQLLMEYCDRLLDSTDLVNNEFYVSGIYKQMLADHLTIGANLVTDFHCVGTPEQLKIFCETHQAPAVLRFCFDLDHTLVTEPQVAGRYDTCAPINENIKLLRQLKEQGHYIIINTARRMRTHAGNLGAVIADIGHSTMQQLDEMGIVYDELHFGKPHADYYIDDKAVNAHESLEKQLGFYNTVVAARDFNSVEMGSDRVVKRGRIAGERYYYSEIDKYPGLKSMFAQVLDMDDDRLVLQRINGLNFSYLYSNNCLSTHQFQQLLEALWRLHENTVDYPAQKICCGIIDKIRDRYEHNDYTLFLGHEKLYAQIQEFMVQFYSRHSVQPVIVHGDPVFSNVLIDGQNNITFIDMRGAQGSDLTIAGDAVYDLAKVYQSLSGYDFILNDKVRHPDQQLMDHFSRWVTDRYDLDITDIKKYAAGLYFSLIPLHADHRCQTYFRQALNLIG